MISLKKLSRVCCLSALFIFCLQGEVFGCANLTPGLSISQGNTCGVPRVFTISNTSTGTNAAGSTYIWKVNGVIIDTTSGTGGTVVYTAPAPGNYTVRVVAITAGNCRDSSSQTINVSTTAGRVQDGNGNASYAPVWQNCINLINNPDSFNLTLTAVDTLRSYTIIWGDASTNSSGLKLNPGASITHTYHSLGDFTVKIVTVNGSCHDTITGSVINNRIPTAGIVGPPAGQNSGCAPHTIRFINNSSNVSASTYFRWTYGDGIVENRTLAVDTVYHTYRKGLGAAGCNITVRLEAINSCGTSQTTWNPVNIYDIDRAQVTTANANLCTPNQSFTLVNSSVNNCIGGTRYFYWDFGDGTTLGWTSSRASQTKSYPVGTYPVMLIDSNACGKDTNYLNIMVNQLPVVNFGFNKASGCAPLNVSFNDTSSGLLNSYNWNFGDPASGGANTSTLRNPSHLFNNQGFFPVNLTVSNYCGTASKRDTIKAYGKPNVNIGNLSSGCAPLSTGFTNTTLYNSSSAQYLWDLGDGTGSTARNAPGKTYSTPGTYIIKLKITDTCGTDSSTRTLNVYNVPTAKFGATRVCAGDTTRFTDSSTVVTGDTIQGWLWNFGDATTSTQKNPKKVYNAAGTYQVILRVTTQNGCIDYDTLSIIVDVSPVVSYSVLPTTICDGNVVSLNGTATTPLGSINAYSWDFGTGTGSSAEDTTYLFPSYGKYVVRFTASNTLGCSRSKTDTVTVYPKPVAAFSFSSVCRGAAVQFTNLSSIAGGDSVTAWQWDFESNGVVDQTIKNPSKVYSTADTFTVALRVFSSKGCRDDDTMKVVVRPLPTIGLAVNNTSLCTNDSFVFTNSSSGANQYNWNFGDATTLITSAPGTVKKRYSSATTYVVKLVGTSIFGCKDSTTQTVITRPLPQSAYTSPVYTACAPFTFTFNNASTNADSYRWLVNGVLKSTSFNRPDTTVMNAGQTFTVTLISYNNFNCKPDTLSRVYRTLSNPLPFLSASIDSACGPAEVTFSDQSIFATSIKWTLGNGQSSTANIVTTTYPASATQDTTYFVKLVASNAANCKDSTTAKIRIFPRPVAAFTQSRTDSCGPLVVNFTNQSNHKTGGNINNMKFQWSFGNGVSSIAKDTSVRFTASASKDTLYQVRLISMSRYGCFDTTQGAVKVYPNPKSIFTQSRTDSCGPLAVQFTNASVPNDTGSINIMSFMWKLGNGSTSTGRNATASYVANASKDTVYTVKLLAYSEHGCVDSSSSTVRIYPKPLAAFTQNTLSGCPPLAVQFTNQSSPRDTGSINIMTFKWDFGNGVSSTARNPNLNFFAAYANDTNYQVKMLAYSEHGCVDSLSKTITVRPKPVVNFTPDRNLGCYPLTVNFNNTTLNGKNFYWNFADGVSDTNKHTSHLFQTRPLLDTVYNVKLYGVSPYGCPGDTITKAVTVRYNPVPDFFYDPDTLCGSDLTRLFNTSLGATSFTWILGNGTFTSAINPFGFYTASNTIDTIYRAKLYAYTPYGCVDSIQKPILVAPLPEAGFNVSTFSGCHPLDVNFNAGNSKRAVSYEWDFGDGGSSNSSTPSHTFVNPGVNDVTYKVTLRVFSDKACQDTFIRYIVVHPLPRAAFTFSKINSCDTNGFNFSNASIGAMNYKWTFGDANSSTASDPVHYYQSDPLNDLNYPVQLVAYSAYGCTDTTDKALTVTPIVHADFTGNPLSGCAPLKVNLQNLSSHAKFNFWEYSDGGASAQKDPTHTFALPGFYSIKLIVTDKNNCTDTLERINYIQAYTRPEAKFLANPTFQALPNSTVNFTDLSISGAPLNYLWDFGDNKFSTQQNPAHTYADSGTYKVRLEVDNGRCTDIDSHTVRIDPLPPIADFDAPPAGCPPFTVKFNNKSQNAYKYEWYLDGKKLTDENPEYTFTRPGKYTISLRATGWGGVDDTTKDDYIEVLETPIANFRVNPNEAFLPDADINFVNLSLDATRFLWLVKDRNGNVVKTDTNESPTLNFSDTGAFDVTLVAKSKAGCVDTISDAEVFHVYDKGTVVIPSAFSPDKDGLNDRFYPVFVGLERSDYRFIIFNRWGERVFETHNRDEGWDGNFMGKACQQDVYVWELRGYLVGGKKIVLNGTVTLIR